MTKTFATEAGASRRDDQFNLTGVAVICGCLSSYRCSAFKSLSNRANVA